MSCSLKLSCCGSELPTLPGEVPLTPETVHVMGAVPRA